MSGKGGIVGKGPEIDIGGERGHIERNAERIRKDLIVAAGCYGLWSGAIVRPPEGFRTVQDSQACPCDVPPIGRLDQQRAAVQKNNRLASPETGRERRIPSLKRTRAQQAA